MPSVGILGQVIMFGGNFAPLTWLNCDGQLLAISQNSALFSILGTTFGGDGETTFGLPDLRGRAPIGAGQGPGLTNRQLGQKSGEEEVYLTVNQLPSHSHGIAVNNNKNDAGNTNDPSGNYPGRSDITQYSTTSNANMGGPTTNNGGSQGHNNMQPFLAMRYIICIIGIFPSE